MFGNINDIVENHPDNVIVNIDLYDPTKINKSRYNFKNQVLVKTLDYVGFNFSNIINSTRKLEIKKESENKIFYENGIPMRNTKVKYKNSFIHKTRDVLINPLITKLKLKTKVEIETTEIKSIKVIAYHSSYVDRNK